MMMSQMQEPNVEERNSLDALKTFTAHACEILNLWKILCENQLPCIMDSLLKETYINQFTVMTFGLLIINGHGISSELISALINSDLGDNASIDAVSAQLRENCPNLYRNEDAVFSKANEILLRAKSCMNLDEKEELLQSALKLCKEVAPRMSLEPVCQQFVECQFYSGVLELCLCCAERVDPNDTAKHFDRNKNALDDQEGSLAFTGRRGEGFLSFYMGVYIRTDGTSKVHLRCP